MKRSYRQIAKRFDILLAIGLILATLFICYALINENPLPPVSEISLSSNNDQSEDLAGFLKMSSTDLNTADKEALILLPGIGETLADRILAARRENGPFSSWDDLMTVHGIGKKTIEKLKPVAFLGP